MSREEKIARFRALHAGPRAFVLPNPWDAGSARVLAGLGYQALATSSGACAGVLGRRDGRVTRDEALAHAQAIVAAVDLPVSADLEKCFADAPREAADTIRLAAGVGLAGGSIEDASGYTAGNKEKPISISLTPWSASPPRPRWRRRPAFVLTARTENYLRGKPDLDDTIKRLQAFEKAGADVLMAPGLPASDAVRAVCAAVKKPVNFMAGIRGNPSASPRSKRRACGASASRPRSTARR